LQIEDCRLKIEKRMRISFMLFNLQSEIFNLK